MAAAVTGRAMVYFTFGDTILRDDIDEMYSHFVENETNIGIDKNRNFIKIFETCENSSYYFFLAHIFSLLIQYQDFALSGDLDFYRFLHNRSKMKPLSQYLNKNIQTKISAVKEASFRKSKSVNIDDKESFHSDVKRQQTEEERIQGWLASYNEDIVRKEKPGIMKEKYTEVINIAEKEQNQNRDSRENKTEQVQDKASAEKKRKQSLWKILEDTVQTKTIHEQRLSGLEMLETKQELLSHQASSDCNILPKDGQLMVISTDLPRTCGSIQISSEKSKVPCQRDSPTKKTEQRKITNWFQPTS